MIIAIGQGSCSSVIKVARKPIAGQVLHPGDFEVLGAGYLGAGIKDFITITGPQDGMIHIKKWGIIPLFPTVRIESHIG
jgi:hypothetical protein